MKKISGVFVVSMVVLGCNERSSGFQQSKEKILPVHQLDQKKIDVKYLVTDKYEEMIMTTLFGDSTIMDLVHKKEDLEEVYNTYGICDLDSSVLPKRKYIASFVEESITDEFPFLTFHAYINPFSIYYYDKTSNTEIELNKWKKHPHIR